MSQFLVNSLTSSSYYRSDQLVLSSSRSSTSNTTPYGCNSEIMLDSVGASTETLVPKATKSHQPNFSSPYFFVEQTSDPMVATSRSITNITQPHTAVFRLVGWNCVGVSTETLVSKVTKSHQPSFSPYFSRRQAIGSHPFVAVVGQPGNPSPTKHKPILLFFNIPAEIV
jgi:hypothetical protein